MPSTVFLRRPDASSPEANNNVGSGYWTHAVSSGQTFYLNGRQAPRSVYVSDVRIPCRKAPAPIRERPSISTTRSWARFCGRTLFNSRLAWSDMSNGRRPPKTGPGISQQHRGTLCRQRPRIRCQLGLSEAQGELGAEVLQGILGSLDVPGVLRAAFWFDQFLGIFWKERRATWHQRVLELDDIQSGVLRPRPTPYAATYVLFRIDEPQSGSGADGAG